MWRERGGWWAATGGDKDGVGGGGDSTVCACVICETCDNFHSFGSVHIDPCTGCLLAIMQVQVRTNMHACTHAMLLPAPSLNVSPELLLTTLFLIFVQALSFEQTDQMRALTQLSHLPLERLTFKKPTHTQRYSAAALFFSPSNYALDTQSNSHSGSSAMFRPVYTSGDRKLSEREILGRLPTHMRVAVARGSVFKFGTER